MKLKAGDYVLLSRAKGCHSYWERELIDLFPNVLGGLLVTEPEIAYYSLSCFVAVLNNSCCCKTNS